MSLRSPRTALAPDRGSSVVPDCEWYGTIDRFFIANVTRSAARSDVAPSTQKMSGNEYMRRKPPNAGPMLMPRLIASRFTENALLLRSEGTTLVMTAREAGRNASPVTDQRIVPPMMAGRVDAKGNNARTTPEQNRDVFITRTGPTTSLNRPAKGEVQSALSPYTDMTSPASLGVNPRLDVR